MSADRTIPILPCRAIDEVLDFYTAIGFEITYQQERPNNYACIERGGIALHFNSFKGFVPEDSYASCIVVVADADALYAAFVDGMRRKYGKKLVKGIPRMTELRDKSSGGRGFNIIDPGGNWIRIVQPDAAPQDAVSPYPPSRLSKAVDTAHVLAESKGDFPAAAKLLDSALKNAGDAPAVHHVQALIARAGVAAMSDDNALAAQFLADMRAISLNDDERAFLAADFDRAAALSQMFD